MSPTTHPTSNPSSNPSIAPTQAPSARPTNSPSTNPTICGSCTSTKWIEIAQENVGNTGTNKFRFLDFGNEIYSNYSMCEILKYKIEWQSLFQEYIVFELNDQYKDHHIFEDTPASIGQYIRINILESSNTANFPIENNHYFCKACSSQYGTKYGDSCWAVTLNSDTNRGCGCSGGGWAGIGIYYGGWDVGQCNICGCWGGAFTGYVAASGYNPQLPKQNAKGNVTSVGLRISIEVCDPTMAPTINPTNNPTMTSYVYFRLNSIVDLLLNFNIGCNNIQPQFPVYHQVNILHQYLPNYHLHLQHKIQP